MTDKQSLFVQEYLIDLNATKAAIRAGYSKRTANEQGARLLAKVSIRKSIQEAMKEREQRTEITQDRVLQELAIIAFADMKDYIEIDDYGGVKIIPFDDARMPEGASRAVSGVKEVRRIMGSGEGAGKDMVMEIRQEYKHHDKVKALELIGNHLSMWKDKSEIIFPDVETFELPKLKIPKKIAEERQHRDEGQSG